MIPALILFALGAHSWAKVGAYSVCAQTAHYERDDVAARRLGSLVLRHLTLAVITWALGVCGLIWVASEMR